MEGAHLTDWHCIETSPSEFSSPDELNHGSKRWIPARVPGTVAAALQEANLWDISTLNNFDASDWWYYCSFSLDESEKSENKMLRFEGLATLAEIWLNGTLLQTSDNMFVPVELDLSAKLDTQNELLICFRSLKEALAQRRPRPKWKTRLVADQQLRWIRTTLLGKIPGWCPPISPVGPWLPIQLIDSTLSPRNLEIKTSLEGHDGQVELSFTLAVKSARAIFQVGDNQVELAQKSFEGNTVFTGTINLPNVKLWWPHTHGNPNLYTATLSLQVDGKLIRHDLSAVGFKAVTIDKTDGCFTFAINGEKVFCRGACWTVNDLISLTGDPQKLRDTLEYMRTAGANMIRVGGTMIYEQDLFYQICDELGIMVWQDFMFANMDYPDEEQFISGVRNEATFQIKRLAKYVCLSMLCGNSEIEQQVAMLGFPSHYWDNEIFYNLLPTLCEDLAPKLPYIPSTPTGGVMPFHSQEGLTHYYGIGAYQRSLNEVSSHQVKFSPESMGFSNVPCKQTRDEMFKGLIPVTHDPIWKKAVPRDTGSGWDFEDIRDFYLKELFDVNPSNLRYEDINRYLSLSEIVSGELVRQTFGIWRQQDSGCGGALIWLMKDFYDGAGWGIIDSQLRPKAIYYFLKRAWQPKHVSIANASLNGLLITTANDSAEPLEANLEILIFGINGNILKTEKSSISIPRRSSVTSNLESYLESFVDPNYFYRFGPLNYLAIQVRLSSAGSLIDEDWNFPRNPLSNIPNNPEISIDLTEKDDNQVLMEISSNSFLYAVNFHVNGYLPDDNFFNIGPTYPKSILFKKLLDSEYKFKGVLEALNMNNSMSFKLSRRES